MYSYQDIFNAKTCTTSSSFTVLIEVLGVVTFKVTFDSEEVAQIFVVINTDGDNQQEEIECPYPIPEDTLDFASHEYSCNIIHFTY